MAETVGPSSSGQEEALTPTYVLLVLKKDSGPPGMPAAQTFPETDEALKALGEGDYAVYRAKYKKGGPPGNFAFLREISVKASRPKLTEL